MQPPSESLNNIVRSATTTHTYVPESYIQQISNAGGQAVLVSFDLPVLLLYKVLDQLDMFLFPGGPADLISGDGEVTPFQQSAHDIIEWAKKRNDEGRYFPIFATCLGMEAMMISVAGNNISILQGGFANAFKNRTLTVDATEFASSKLYSNVDQKTFEDFGSEGLAYYNHNYAVFKSYFLKNPMLKSSFRIVCTTKFDRIREEFVACIEHRKYPFLANQWHPEKYQNEKGTYYTFIERSSRYMKMLNQLLMKMVDSVRGSSKPLSKMSPIVKQFLTSSHTPIQTAFTASERVYLLPRFMP